MFFRAAFGTAAVLPRLRWRIFTTGSVRMVLRLASRRILAAAGALAFIGLSGCAGSDGTGLGLNLVSQDQVQQMGIESWERLKAETQRSDNASYQASLEKVGSRVLSAIGENPAAWEMIVFAGDEANAFALPGNKIGVFEGMFNYARNEEQLAAVIGHEIAHNQQHHAAERMNTQLGTQLGLQAVSAALQVGNVGYANQIAGVLGMGAQYGVILPYGRNQELEADRLGLVSMARAGYDPRAAVALWENMREAGPRPAEFTSTHPSPDNRIARLQEMMPEALRIYEAQARS